MVRSESADEERSLDDKEMDEEYNDNSSITFDKKDLWSDHKTMGGGGSSSVSPNSPDKNSNVDMDRRIRRQIANCNERRRMQSINAGFQSLRALLPRKEGEKLSKAAILQQTAQLIQTLREERNRILERSASSEEDTSVRPSGVWKKPRLERDTESNYTNDSSSSIESCIISELQNELEKERVMRMYYESKLRAINSASSTPTSTPLSPIPLSSIPLSSLCGSPMNIESPRRMVDTTCDSGVIRPTPTQPLRVDVSLANLVSLHSGVVHDSTRPSPQMAVASSLNSSASLTPRPLNAILEAIRHLEGGSLSSASSSSHSNLLVR